MACEAYTVDPNDINMDFLDSVPGVTATIARHEAAAAASDSAPWRNLRSQQFLEAITQARAAAGEIGWEGDFREGSRVFWIPNSRTGALDFGFIWKQDNDSATMIVSPLPLPWLDD